MRTPHTRCNHHQPPPDGHTDKLSSSNQTDGEIMHCKFAMQLSSARRQRQTSPPATLVCPNQTCLTLLLFNITRRHQPNALIQTPSTTSSTTIYADTTTSLETEVRVSRRSPSRRPSVFAPPDRLTRLPRRRPPSPRRPSPSSWTAAAATPTLRHSNTNQPSTRRDAVSHYYE